MILNLVIRHTDGTKESYKFTDVKNYALHCVDLSVREEPMDVPTWAEDVAALVREGMKMSAVKLYREITGASLMDAVDTVRRIEHEINKQETKDD